jgi:hypothetical protein
MVSRIASAAELDVFYCYAPDVASGVVYLSQALPVGPIGERAGYGREFAGWLRSNHRVGGDVQAYCVMRATADEIARAQASLSSEPCPECAGLTRFVPVNWPRERAHAPPTIRADTVARGTSADPDRPPRHAAGTVLVVMGNVETGKLLVVSNQSDAVSAAQSQARMIRPTGWKTLLTTSEPGFGAAFCVRHGDATRFFLAHAQPSMKEAISRARESAAPYAAETSQEARICGAPWNAQAGEMPPREEGVIDALKDAIREEVTCDRDAKAADANSRPCPERDPSFTGVRG